MDFMETIAVFVPGKFACAVADFLVFVAPVWQATGDIIFVSADLSRFCHARLDYGLDRCLLNNGQHANKALPTALDHSEDGRLVLFQSAAALRSLEAPASADFLGLFASLIAEAGS